eukprot:12047492-Alexandrium_andersonii.AAC.1
MERPGLARAAATEDAEALRMDVRRPRAAPAELVEHVLLIALAHLAGIAADGLDAGHVPGKGGFVGMCPS